MRVLIVEDDAALAQAIELMLKAAGMVVETTDLGEDAIDLAKVYDYDIITLDLELPDMSGLEVLRKIRGAKIATPILILTGISALETKVKALGMGADEYMTKPFHNDELVARIQAVVRRSKGHPQSIITTGPIAVNLDAKRVEVSGSRLHLTGKEYQMLELLSMRKGSTLTKENFLNHLYGGMDEPEIKIIDVFICKLRGKLSRACPDAGRHIHTVWGRGYVLNDEVQVLQPSGAGGGRTASIQAAIVRAKVTDALKGGALSMRDIQATIDAPVEKIVYAVHSMKSDGLLSSVARPGAREDRWLYNLAPPATGTTEPAHVQ